MYPHFFFNLEWLCPSEINPLPLQMYIYIISIALNAFAVPYSPSERTGRSPSSVVCCFSAFYINILFNLHQTCAVPTLFEVGMLLYSAYIYNLYIIFFRNMKVIKEYIPTLVRNFVTTIPLLHTVWISFRSSHLDVLPNHRLLAQEWYTE